MKTRRATVRIRPRTRTQASSPASPFGMAPGLALVLIVLPGAALVFGLSYLANRPSVGLPLLAIFGIVILLGSLALVSALFSRLGLANPAEALGLPSGSIRATVALALIVLFALIAVMLYQTLDGGRTVSGVMEAQKAAFLKDPLIHVRSVTPVACAASATDCPGGYRFDLVVDAPAGVAASDFAKQLLTLVGTLMTSVVSYYFAAKSSESAMKAVAAVDDEATDSPDDPPDETLDERPRLADLPTNAAL
ncbi:hypothetical protein [Roseateles sp. L2-2]|uniref:hypothetical protein n=1 Tax=Roseateles TaxID=93681 RepID=UPI003D36D5CF